MVRDAYLEGSGGHRPDKDTPEKYIQPRPRATLEQGLADRSLGKDPWAGIDPVEVNDILRNVQQSLNEQRLG